MYSINQTLHLETTLKVQIHDEFWNTCISHTWPAKKQKTKTKTKTHKTPWRGWQTKQKEWSIPLTLYLDFSQFVNFLWISIVSLPFSRNGCAACINARSAAISWKRWRYGWSSSIIIYACTIILDPRPKKKKLLCCPLPTDRKMRKNRVGFFCWKCQIWAKNLLKFVFIGLKKHLYICVLTAYRPSFPHLETLKKILENSTRSRYVKKKKKNPTDWPNFQILVGWGQHNNFFFLPNNIPQYLK